MAKGYKIGVPFFSREMINCGRFQKGGVCVAYRIAIFL